MSAAVVEAPSAVDPATPEQTLERIRVVIGWLLDGVPASAALDKIKEEWAVGRTAQIYVKRARQLLAEDAEEEELRYYRRLSQQQRDRLIYVLFRALKTVDQMDTKVLRSLASIITAGTKLLESRDRLVLGEAQDEQRERKRLQSEEANRLIAEGEASLKAHRQLMKDSPLAPRKQPRPQPPATPRPFRALEPGEPVFDRNRPLDQRAMTPKQLEEWLECLEQKGDPRLFPWFKDGALEAALDPNPSDAKAVARQREAFDNAFNPDVIEQWQQPANPASAIAIVPPAKKGKSASATISTQDKSG